VNIWRGSWQQLVRRATVGSFEETAQSWLPEFMGVLGGTLAGKETYTWYLAE
jgi:hypothetical protein